MPQPRTTLIIPNYNGARHLPALWDSIRGLTRQPARILLVDNGSTDGSQTHLPEGVDLLALPGNLGFAAAVNRGINQTHTPFAAILNNDVVLHAHWLATLEECLDMHPAQFACPLLLAADAPHLADGAFDLVCRSGTAARVLHRVPITHPAATTASPIQFPPMTAALFRTDAFSRVGPLNEALESYYEDVEWGLRAASLGMRGVFVPQARATHKGSATLGKGSAKATYLIARNQLLAVASTYPTSLLRRWWWPILWGNLLHLLACLRRGRGWPALCGKVAGLRRWPSLRKTRRRSLQTQNQTTLHTHQANLRTAILESEAHWRLLAPDTDGGFFWRLYFALTPSLPAHHSNNPTPA